jgi:hypothetical protein
MDVATCESCTPQNSQQAPEVNQAVVLQRMCSAVMLLLSGAAVFASGHWTYVTAFVASVVSMLATWFDKRWGGPIWAACTTVGFGLWAWWQL